MITKSISRIGALTFYMEQVNSSVGVHDAVLNVAAAIAYIFKRHQPQICMERLYETI